MLWERYEEIKDKIDIVRAKHTESVELQRDLNERHYKLGHKLCQVVPSNWISDRYVSNITFDEHSDKKLVLHKQGIGYLPSYARKTIFYEGYSDVIKMLSGISKAGVKDILKHVNKANKKWAKKYFEFRVELSMLCEDAELREGIVIEINKPIYLVEGADELDAAEHKVIVKVIQFEWGNNIQLKYTSKKGDNETNINPEHSDFLQEFIMVEQIYNEIVALYDAYIEKLKQRRIEYQKIDEKLNEAFAPILVAKSI